MIMVFRDIIHTFFQKQICIATKLITMDTSFTNCLLSGNNNPTYGEVVFDSSDHIRYQNGINVSGHNYNCHRRIVVKRNIQGEEGYTVAIYNLDGPHPLWKNNIQMAPKQMKITSANNCVIELRGFGYDKFALSLGAPKEAASFSNYGIDLTFENSDI